jgi:hypothetical protein
MAITCSWDKPLGTCYLKEDAEKKHPIVIWGGGNCLAVFTTLRARYLQCFLCDKEHAIRCKNVLINDFTDYVIYRDRKTESKQLIEVLVRLNLPFTVISSSSGRDFYLEGCEEETSND